MSATFAKSPNKSSTESTSEPAEEPKMETQEAVTTEQPASSPVHMGSVKPAAEASGVKEKAKEVKTSPAVAEKPKVEKKPPVIAEKPKVENKPPAVAEKPKVEKQAPAIAEKPKVGNKVPAVAEKPKVENKAPAVAEKPKVENKAPAVAEKPKVENKAPAVEGKPKVENKAPAVEGKPIVESQAPAVEGKPKVESQAPAVAEKPKVENKASAVAEQPKVENKAPAVAEQPKVENKVPAVEGKPKVESQAPAVEEKSGQTPNADKGEKVADSSVKKEKKGDEKMGDTEGNEDGLDRLARVVADFDPVAILNRKSEVKPANSNLPISSKFSRDINDEKLIDDLVKDVNEKVGESKKGDGDDDSNEREITPDSEEDNSGNNNNNITGTDSNIDTKSDYPADANGCESEEEDQVETNGIEDQDNKEEAKTDDKSDAKTAEKVSEVKPSRTDKSSSTTKKSKRKEDKSIDHILKALSSLQTTEEKLAALCKKYADLHEEHRVLQATFKQGQRKLTVISREKDQLQTEHTKAVMAKSKLEGLCRELQKHNQSIRQESLQRAREEDEKRKEISLKFQKTIEEIQTQMQENHDKNKQLSQENFDLANKLKKFIDQYEAREKQIEKIMQHRELEQKLADAKLEQASAILMEEKGKNQKERELLLMQTTEYVKKLQIKEAELTMYKERYEEFQSTIKKSEEMFQKFKSEMDKMTKRCKKLEKDGVQWKQKWENANRALLEMASEKTKYDKERPMLLSKISKLESLCRAMQAERKARKILESDGIDVSKLTMDDDEPSDELAKIESAEMDTASAGATGLAPSPVEEPNSTTPEGEPESEDKSDAGSCQSSASENTGVTVIQQDSPPPGDGQSNGGTDSQSNSGTDTQPTPEESNSQSTPEESGPPEQQQQQPSETTAS